MIEPLYSYWSFFFITNKKNKVQGKHRVIEICKKNYKNTDNCDWWDKN